MADKAKDVKVGTCKYFTTDEGLQFIAIARNDLFGKPDIVLVSEDGKHWIAHDPDKLSQKIDKGEPIQVS